MQRKLHVFIINSFTTDLVTNCVLLKESISPRDVLIVGKNNISKSCFNKFKYWLNYDNLIKTKNQLDLKKHYKVLFFILSKLKYINLYLPHSLDLWPQVLLRGFRARSYYFVEEGFASYYGKFSNMENKLSRTLCKSAGVIFERDLNYKGCFGLSLNSFVNDKKHRVLLIEESKLLINRLKKDNCKKKQRRPLIVILLPNYLNGLDIVDEWFEKVQNLISHLGIDLREVFVIVRTRPSCRGDKHGEWSAYVLSRLRMEYSSHVHLANADYIEPLLIKWTNVYLLSTDNSSMHLYSELYNIKTIWWDGEGADEFGFHNFLNLSLTTIINPPKQARFNN